MTQAPAITSVTPAAPESVVPEYAIEVSELSKEYRIYGNPYHRLLELLPGVKDRHRKVWALRDVSLRIEPGHTVGLVGPNGAGKSTLLKILTGTTFPTQGSYKIRGRVASLLELGAGFHPEFSGRDNIFLNAALMGLSREETLEKFESIIEFSELGAFIDSPIRTYSSGMVCRLAFSIAVAIDPDVMIIDEILAVGDMHFQRKCVERIYEFKNAGKTILFCSHSLYDLRQLCDQAIWMQEGRARLTGDSVMVTNEYAAYEKALLGRESDVLEHLPGEKVGEGPQGPHVESIELLDPATDEPCYEGVPGQPLRVRVRYNNGDEPIPLCLGVGFTRTDKTLCFGNVSLHDGLVLNEASGTVDLDFDRLCLLTGEFVVFVWLLDGKGVHRYHEALAPRNFKVLNQGLEVGLFLQEHRWTVRE